MVFGTVPHTPGAPETITEAAAEGLTASNIAAVSLGVVGLVGVYLGAKMIITGEKPWGKR